MHSTIHSTTMVNLLLLFVSGINLSTNFPNIPLKLWRNKKVTIFADNFLAMYKWQTVYNNSANQIVAFAQAYSNRIQIKYKYYYEIYNHGKNTSTSSIIQNSSRMLTVSEPCTTVIPSKLPEFQHLRVLLGKPLLYHCTQDLFSLIIVRWGELHTALKDVTASWCQ